MTNFKAIVRCPKCGFKQKTTTIRKVRCHNCLKDYTVVPIMGKGKPKIRPRIDMVISGSAFAEYWKEKKRRLEVLFNGKK